MTDLQGENCQRELRIEHLFLNQSLLLLKSNLAVAEEGSNAIAYYVQIIIIIGICIYVMIHIIILTSDVNEPMWCLF